jgi:hypothetical protein
MALVSGKWLSADVQVDHINGDRSDNRLSNLRVVSQSINQKNQSARIDSKTGIPGVSFRAKEDRWLLRYRDDDGRRVHKRFKTLEEATAARMMIGGQFGYATGIRPASTWQIDKIRRREGAFPADRFISSQEPSPSRRTAGQR